jgi:hypothetical protein
MGSGYRNSILQSISLDLNEARNKPVPDVLRLEVTNGCNDKCIFCGNRKMSRKIGFIREAIVEKALAQAYDMGVRKVSFYTIGEPFLHPGLSKFVAMAKLKGYTYLFLNTNGALLTFDNLIAVINAGIDSIAFSINAINAKDYLLIHGKDDFEKVLDNLSCLFTLREQGKMGFHIYISFIKTRLTDYSEDKIRLFFAGKCDEVGIQNVQNIGGFLPEIDLFDVESSDLFFHYEIPCRLLFKSLTVTCEGYLTACSVDFQNYLVYADLNADNISTAWHNDTITGLRRRHLSNNVTGLLCDNCANFSKNNPVPLSLPYATYFNMNDIFSSGDAKSRIEKWSESNHDETSF